MWRPARSSCSTSPSHYTPSAQTGKPSGNDLREGKVTLPLLTVLDRVGEERRSELLARLARCRDEEAEVEYLQRIVAGEGGLDRAAEVMRHYISRAVGQLSDYAESPGRKALADLCVYVAERDR